MKEIRLVDVSKRYGSKSALRRVNLTLSAGEVVGVRGPNGAGKSTLLRVMSTLMEPSSGAVLVDDRNLWAEASVNSFRGQVGWLGHGPSLYLDLSARENLTLFSDINTPADNHQGKDVDQVLAQIGLVGAGSRRARAFSRGMLQRLALGRLLVQGAPLWLLDEPSTGLDTESRELLVRIVREHKEEGGMAVVVSHHPELLGVMCDRQWVLKRGQVV